MKKLFYKFLSYFTTKKGEFPYTTKGFDAAKTWAQSQPHPYSENLSLWESIYTTADDGWYVIQQINQHKKLYDSYQRVKSNKKRNSLNINDLYNEIN